jgi:hypothetical protein
MWKQLHPLRVASSIYEFWWGVHETPLARVNSGEGGGAPQVKEGSLHNPLVEPAGRIWGSSFREITLDQHESDERQAWVSQGGSDTEEFVL